MAGGQHEDGQRGASTAQSLGDFKAADLGHPPVEDSDLVLVGGEVAQRQFTDASTADAVKKGWSLVTVA